MTKKNSAPTGGPVKRMLALPNDHPAKTIMIALLLCLVCASLVSAAAILLRPLQQANEEILSKQREIMRAVGLDLSGADISTAFGNVEARVVDLPSGEYVSGIDAYSYNYDKASLEPATQLKISPQDDIAKVNPISRYAPVYLFQDQGKTTHIVIPVYGYGLWSTMRAYLAVQADGNHITGIVFYQHGETPGLGGEISNPRWQELWKGKQIYDAEGKVKLQLVKNADIDEKFAQHQIDALAGATITSNGVTNLIRFWLGDQGYGPYFKRNFRQGD